MDLNKLFPLQKELDEYIIKEKGLEGQDLLQRKAVALICELYECVNEARFFKFWSDNQKPRKYIYTNSKIKNPLLEEYVDVIHFLLSIANDFDCTHHTYEPIPTMDLNALTLGITNIATVLQESKSDYMLYTLFNHIIKLGYQLGFTEQEVIDAYMKKHEENYNRQKVGY